MKSQLTSLDIHAISKDFQVLQNSYFDKIYQLTKDEFLIKFNTKQGRKTIFIKNGKYICFTENEFPKENPTNFAMVIRKHLNNAKVISVYQKNFERILVMEFQKAKKYFLIVELFSDGNIILADEEKIIANLLSQEWKDRTIKVGREYKFPPLRENPKEMGYEKFKEILQNAKKDLVRTLVSEVNLSGEYAEEICLNSEIEKSEKTTNLKDEQFKKLFTSMKELFGREFHPNIVLKDGAYFDVLPIKLNLYKNYVTKIFDTFSNAIEQYFSQIKEEKKEETDLTKLEKERILRRLNQQENALNEIEKEINEIQKITELIYVNYNEINDLLNFAKEYFSIEGKKEKNEFMKKIEKMYFGKDDKTLINLDKIKNIEFDEENKTISFSTDGINIQLNANKSVQENAEQYYNLTKKSKEKILGIRKAIEDTKKKLNEVEQIKEFPKEEKKEKLKKDLWFEKYKWTFSTDGNLIIGGRDAKTNEEVVKKHLNEKDRYCHADIHGASSVVIKKDIKLVEKNLKNEKTDFNNGYTENKNKQSISVKNSNENLSHSIVEKTKLIKSFILKTIPGEISENTLKQGCEFAIIHSKAWSSKFSNASAYWVLPEQVSKTPESGEFLPKGAFVIRGKRNYVEGKLQCAICKIEIDGVEKIACFPISAVKKYSDNYIVLEIGDIDKNNIAKEIVKKFDCDIEEVLKILPSGEFRIRKLL